LSCFRDEEESQSTNPGVSNSKMYKGRIEKENVSSGRVLK
jgi:hypothetical protein